MKNIKMDEKKYRKEDKEKNTETDNYKRYPSLISGLKESCLCRLIKLEDILELRIIPAQRK